MKRLAATAATLALLGIAALPVVSCNESASIRVGSDVADCASGATEEGPPPRWVVEALRGRLRRGRAGAETGCVGAGATRQRHEKNLVRCDTSWAFARVPG